MAPNLGPLVESINPACARPQGCGNAWILPASKAEVGEITIADRDIGADEQQAVDGRQEAAEESIGRGKPNRSGIEHFWPHFW
jgi:hypothetical protein